MNQKTIIIAVIAVLVIVGAYMLMGNHKDAIAPSLEQTEGMQKSTFAKGETSFRDLMRSAVPQKCTFDKTEGGVKSSGTIYSSEGKIRVDTEMISTTNASVQSMHMLSADGLMYVWADKEKVGMKMKIDMNATGTPTSGAAVQNDDLNKKANVDCSAWMPDAVSFQVPTSINFQDMDEMMKNMIAPQMKTPALKGETP